PSYALTLRPAGGSTRKQNSPSLITSAHDELSRPRNGHEPAGVLPLRPADAVAVVASVQDTGVGGTPGGCCNAESRRPDVASKRTTPGLHEYDRLRVLRDFGFALGLLALALARAAGLLVRGAVEAELRTDARQHLFAVRVEAVFRRRQAGDQPVQLG